MEELMECRIMFQMTIIENTAFKSALNEDNPIVERENSGSKEGPDILSLGSQNPHT